MKEQAFWFLARASGFTAYLLITASMIAGLILKSRPFGAKLKAPIALDVHRFTDPWRWRRSAFTGSPSSQTRPSRSPSETS